MCEVKDQPSAPVPTHEHPAASLIRGVVPSHILERLTHFRLSLQRPPIRAIDDHRPPRARLAFHKRPRGRVGSSLGSLVPRPSSEHVQTCLAQIAGLRRLLRSLVVDEERSQVFESQLCELHGVEEDESVRRGPCVLEEVAFYFVETFSVPVDSVEFGEFGSDESEAYPGLPNCCQNLHFSLNSAVECLSAGLAVLVSCLLSGSDFGLWQP